MVYSPNEMPVPGYRLMDILGRGGFGEVWRAEGPGGIQTALKIIDLSTRQGHKELRALRRVKLINHPNLVPITGIWLTNQKGKVLEDEEREDVESSLDTYSAPSHAETVVLSRQDKSELAMDLILAMGLCEQTLQDRLNECLEAGLVGVPIGELLRYMEEAAKGIDYLNSPRHDLGSGPVGIQHCDIKPSNLMIVGGAIQVCDFGLARVVHDNRKTMPALTPAYSAPEMLNGEQPSTATDQYALAVSYVELRSGHLPFDTDSFMGIANAHMEGTLDLSRLPDAEREVISRALSVDPKDRFVSVGEMVQALKIAVAAVTEADHTESIEESSLVRSAASAETMSQGASSTLPVMPNYESPISSSSSAKKPARLSWKVGTGLASILFICGLIALWPPKTPPPPLVGSGPFALPELHKQLGAIRSRIEHGAQSQESGAEVQAAIRARFANLDTTSFQPLPEGRDKADLFAMIALAQVETFPPSETDIAKLKSKIAEWPESELLHRDTSDWMGQALLDVLASGPTTPP